MSIRSPRSTTQIPMIFNILVNITNIKMDIIINHKIQIITSRKWEGLITRRQLISVILMQQLNNTERILLFNHGKKATSTYISNKKEQEPTLMTKLRIITNMSTKTQLLFLCLLILDLECCCTWPLRCIFNSLLVLWVNSLMTRKR